MRIPIAILSVTLGCASSARTPPTAPLAQPPLRLVDSAYGQEHSKHTDELLVPFGLNQNGTELVLVAMERAEEVGAAFLGDVELIMTFKWRGTPVECRSKVVFADDPVLQQKPPAEPDTEATVYGTDVEGYKPRLVSFRADEEDLVCTAHQRLVARKAGDGWNRHDVSETRLKDRPAGAGQTELAPETAHDCQKRPVVRDTQRYDYEIRHGFVPPNWDYLSTRLSGDRKLAQAPPVCYRIDEAELARLPAYRLVAKTFHQGPFRRKTLPDAPSAGDLEVHDRQSHEQRMAYCLEVGPKGGLGETREEVCERKMRRYENMRRSRIAPLDD